MPAPTTTDEFLEFTRRSGVVDDKDLDAYLSGRGGVLPEPPSSLAVEMVRDGLLTHFQAEQFLQGKWRALHHRQVQGAGTPRLRRHGQRLPVRAQAHAPPRRRQGAAHRQGRRPRRRWSASTARPAPSPPSTIPTSSAPTTSTRTTSCTSSSWSTWTAPACRTSSRRHGPMDVTRAAHYIRQAALGLQHAHERPAWSTATSSRATSSSIAPASSRSSTWAWPASSTTRRTILTKKYDENVLGTADYLRPGAGPRQPRRRYPRRHLQPGRHVLLLPDRPHAVRRRDGGPEADLAPDEGAAAHPRPPARDAPGAGGRRGEDDGQAGRGALPEAGRGVRGPRPLGIGRDRAPTEDEMPKLCPRSKGPGSTDPSSIRRSTSATMVQPRTPRPGPNSDGQESTAITPRPGPRSTRGAKSSKARAAEPEADSDTSPGRPKWLLPAVIGGAALLLLMFVSFGLWWALSDRSKPVAVAPRRAPGPPPTPAGRGRPTSRARCRANPRRRTSPSPRPARAGACIRRSTTPSSPTTAT